MVTEKAAIPHSYDQVPLHVVLIEPEIHWNTGNAGRSCLAAGARLHLVEPLGFTMDAKQIRRAGLDYWPRVKPTIWPDWHSLERSLPLLGEPYFLSPEAPQRLWDARFSNPTVLLFGGESKGLSAEIRESYAARMLSISMQDRGLRSLNLSTTVGIALYEVIRQRRPGSCR